MFAAARKAAAMAFEPVFLKVVLKSLLLTLALFALLFAAVLYGVHHLPPSRWPWLNVMVDWAAPLLAIGAIFFLGAPVAAIFASLFLGEIAQAIEEKYYPSDAQAPGAPPLAHQFVGFRLAAWVIVLGLALLPFDVMLPGIGSAGSLAVSGWLLGREYFELAAMRHLSRSDADALRKLHAAGVFGAGLLIAVLAAIPIVDFLAPLYGAAFMVHFFKHCQHRELLR